MNMKKQYLIFMLVFLFLILGTTISYGGYSASSSTVESCGKIAVKITSSEPLDAYNLDLKSCEGLTFNSCSKTENGAIINIIYNNSKSTISRRYFKRFWTKQ